LKANGMKVEKQLFFSLLNLARNVLLKKADIFAR
jgi:hypothetical protein